jgi:hypothetical protein
MAKGTKGSFAGKVAGTGKGKGKAKPAISGGSKSVPPGIISPSIIPAAPSLKEMGIDKHLADRARKAAATVGVDSASTVKSERDVPLTLRRSLAGAAYGPGALG